MECHMCGSKLKEGSNICEVCGTLVEQKETTNQPIVNSIPNNQNNMMQSQMNMNYQPICCDFVCPCCRTRIPENQLYRFIQRPMVMNNPNMFSNNINNGGN